MPAHILGLRAPPIFAAIRGDTAAYAFWALLGWLLAQKPWIVPIPGTTKLDRLEENLGGADIAFDGNELTDLTDAPSQLNLIGDRMPKAYLDLTEQ